MTAQQLLCMNIRERQLLSGITTAWDPTDPKNVAKLIDIYDTPAYSLAELKAYVAAWDGLWLDPVTADAWCEGADSAADWTKIDATYGAGAADVAALNALVCALRHRVEGMTWSPLTGWQTTTDMDLAICTSRALAEAAYAAWWTANLSTTPASYPQRTISVLNDVSPDFQLKHWGGGGCPVSRVTTVPAGEDGIHKSVRVMYQVTTLGTYQTFGDHAVVENEWHQFAAITLADTATDGTAAAADMPQALPADYGWDGTNGQRGWTAGQRRIVLTCVCHNYGVVDQPDPADYTVNEKQQGVVILSNENCYFYNLATDTWTNTTPAPGDFPAGPANGDLWDDTENMVRWTYCDEDTTWRGQYLGRDLAQGAERWGTRITMGAGETRYLLDLGRDQAPDSALALVALATATWATSCYIENATHRCVTIVVGSAPAYDALVHVQLWIENL